ncbi:hypothetical protein OE230_04540 [Levilactobacillus brevis]|nr:hypothetical protein OE230_04540 [Levilactobacillus brevis]
MKKTLSIIATVAAFAGLGLASGTVAHAAVKRLKTPGLPLVGTLQ